VISVDEATLNVAEVPSKLTLVVPVRLLPRIFTGVPTSPEVGSSFTKGPSPTPRTKTVPSPLVPPFVVVP
jgi:hypothetical protein